MDGTHGIEELCSRLAEIKDVFLPIKQENVQDEKAAEEDLTEENRISVLQNYFQKSPIKFLQRYHTYIKPEEISCFNDLPENDQLSYYIKKICHQQDLESRTELDRDYLSQEVKNRRYKALQKLIKEGEYFSEEEMEKRSPALYQYYIGQYLTDEEKEEKLIARAAAHPASLSGFFMDVIERKQEQEEMEEAVEEEFDEDSDEEEEQGQQEAAETLIPDEEKMYLAKEFESRMYQHFLDGMDKNFSYETVDENAEYDDIAQIDRDVEDDYFDDEKPSDLKTGDSVPMKQEEEESEDELDKYMKTLQDTKKDGTSKIAENDTAGDKKEVIT